MHARAVRDTSQNLRSGEITEERKAKISVPGEQHEREWRRQWHVKDPGAVKSLSDRLCLFKPIFQDVISI